MVVCTAMGRVHLGRLNPGKYLVHMDTGHNHPFFMSGLRTDPLTGMRETPARAFRCRVSPKGTTVADKQSGGQYDVTSVLPRCTFADPTRHLRYFPRSFTNESAASTMHATNSIMVNPFPPANPSHLDSTSMNTAVLHRLYSRPYA